MIVAPKERLTKPNPRTLVDMAKDLKEFREKHRGDLRHAKLHTNVIDDPYFTIPVEYVSNNFLCYIDSVSLSSRLIRLTTKAWKTKIQ